MKVCRTLVVLALIVSLVQGLELCLFAQTQQRSVTNAELLKILKIKTFRVRTLPDPWVWNIEVVNKKDVRAVGQPKNGLWAGIGLLALRDIGNDVYEFTLPEHSGAFSQGKFELCKQVECAGQYSLKWLKSPRYSLDGTQCLLAEFEKLGEDSPSAYIALHRTRSHE
jgi:hypothetical protein